MDRSKLIDRARELGDNLNPKSLYGFLFKQNQTQLEALLFEIAQQANTNEITKKGMIKTVGSEIVEISLYLFPNLTLEDKYES